MKKKKLLHLLMTFGFLLGIRDGYIALWRGSEPEPLEIFPYKAELLPECDQKALQRGIVIQDGSSLARLLEDYLS